MARQAIASLDVFEAVGKVRMFRARRDTIDPLAERDLLSAPGCERGCPVCPRSCALTGIMLRWWEEELARLTGSTNDNERLH